MFFDESTKVSDEEARIRMLPTENRVYGFLAKDEKMEERIAVDTQIMITLGLQFESFAKKIEEIFHGTDANCNGHKLLRIEYIAGMLCPWNDFLSSEPFDFTPRVREIIIMHRDKIDVAMRILNMGTPHSRVNINTYRELVDSDVAMILSDLHPHLLREHHFCQGIGNPYRIEPSKVKEYLGDT